MIEVQHLCKKYGNFTAVDNISFTVHDGEIVGFLGLNGAGKSTTMNMLTGYLAMTSGEVSVNGIQMTQNPMECRRQIGYLPEIPPLYPEMTVKDYLSFIYDLKHIHLKNKAEHLYTVMKESGIERVADRIIGHLSKGYRQRVGIAYSMIGNPPILILDEPTAGLDPRQIVEIRGLISRLGQKHTILLSTHILPEVQAVCERMMILQHGKIVLDEKMEAVLHENKGGEDIFVALEGEKDLICKAISKIANVRIIESSPADYPDTNRYHVVTIGRTDIRHEISALAAINGWPILEMRENRMSMEERFIQLTSDGSEYS